jgi:hypothetical protein
MTRTKLAQARGKGPKHRAMFQPGPVARLAKEQDNSVIEQLVTAPLGTLKVDHFAKLLRGQVDSREARLRIALIKIYRAAAHFRAETKVPKKKIKSAKAALNALWKAAKHLEQVKPRHMRGLKGVLGIPGDDPKGLDELSSFSSRCSAARLEVAKIAMNLGKETKAEKTKPGAKGERKKRLRILTEGLAEWWIGATGKPIAPYVQTKPLGNHRAFVVRRSGRFIEFAVSILAELDKFKPSEIISAVTNVYDERRRRSNRLVAPRVAEIAFRGFCMVAAEFLESFVAEALAADKIRTGMLGQSTVSKNGGPEYTLCTCRCRVRPPRFAGRAQRKLAHCADDFRLPARGLKPVLPP